MTRSQLTRPPALQLVDLSKSYEVEGQRRRVLESFNLTVEAGEFVIVRGASGSGKSTLLRLSGLLTPPDHGQVWIDGRETAVTGADADRIRRERIGMVFQFPSLFPHLTVEENIQIAARPDVNRDRIRELLATFGMQDRWGDTAAGLSGGEAQRVTVCRAMVNSPAIVLADEPTNGLDPFNRDRVLEALTAARNQGAAVVMVTHEEALLPAADSIITIEGAARG